MQPGARGSGTLPDKGRPQLPAWFAAPRTGGTLVEHAETIEAEGRVYPRCRSLTHVYVDFTAAGLSSELARQQRAIYDVDESRYRRQLLDDPDFMPRFIARFVRGRVRNKDALLHRALAGLPLTPASRVVEVGCNDGRFLNALCALFGCSGAGFDISRAAVERALAARPQGLHTCFHVAEAEALPVASGSVDALIALDVLEHLGHDGCRRFFAEARRVLAPGGHLVAYVVSRKDRFSFHETLRAISGGRAGRDDGEGHVYENFLLPDEWRAMVGEAGLITRSLEAYHGFWTLYFEEELKNRLPELGFTLLRLLDYPLVRSEHGNGFLGVARSPA